MVVMLMLIILSFMVLMFLSLTSLFLMNSGVLMITFKVFSYGFYSDLEILFSVWSFLFLVMVLFIGTSVLFFSYSYFSVTSVNNFLLIYLSFILSMTWLILNNNFYWMMFGWDGLGVTSFLLIVYYMNNESINNGLFTVFQNRLGDVFFVIFLVSIINLSIQSSLYIPLSMIFLVLGASVKSAQYPFNMWLLAAMSAPTPISALVHSSTLVVAGVYILLEYSYCLGGWLSVLKYLSVLTLAMSFFGLVNEKDMKKLIAYSTMSHVALMVYLYSLQLYKIVYFHLNVHAMFKSLMFMSFGFVMLSSYHSQDSRLVSVYSVSPSIKLFYYYSCLCLMGLPFLSAFFSKDFILEKVIEVEGELSSVLLLMLFLSVSVFYSMKLLLIYNVMFVYLAFEKQYLGSISLAMMISVSLILINLLISFVFSISLEIMSFKMMIYLYLLSFMVLVFLVKWNYKLPSFGKGGPLKEMWGVNWYSLDLYVYWTFNLVLNYTNKLMEVKLLLMVNWWVLVGVLYVF